MGLWDRLRLDQNVIIVYPLIILIIVQTITVQNFPGAVSTATVGFYRGEGVPNYGGYSAGAFVLFEIRLQTERKAQALSASGDALRRRLSAERGLFGGAVRCHALRGGA